MRLCIDPKRLNKPLKQNDYPMKIFDDAITEFRGDNYFTYLETHKTFWYVLLDEQSSFLTAFETPCGKFQRNRMQFWGCPLPLKSSKEELTGL